jgi:hypothetical protein
MKNGPSLGGGPEAKLNLQNSAGNPDLLKRQLSRTASGPKSRGNSDSALERLALRANALAARVMAGEMPFIDAIDAAYGYAVGLCLPATAGDDATQLVLTVAFAPARRAL